MAIEQPAPACPYCGSFGLMPTGRKSFLHGGRFSHCQKCGALLAPQISRGETAVATIFRLAVAAALAIIAFFAGKIAAEEFWKGDFSEAWLVAVTVFSLLLAFRLVGKTWREWWPSPGSVLTEARRARGAPYRYFMECPKCRSRALMQDGTPGFDGSTPMNCTGCGTALGADRSRSALLGAWFAMVFGVLFLPTFFGPYALIFLPFLWAAGKYLLKPRPRRVRA